MERSVLFAVRRGPDSSYTSAGNGIQGQQEIQQLFATMPRSRHEVQAFDAHMIPGAPTLVAAPNSRLTRPTGSINTTKPLPSLSLAVTGHVRYQESAFPPNWRMPGTSSVTPGDDPELLPRVFSQSFVLHPTAEGAYKATADVFRFVG